MALRALSPLEEPTAMYVPQRPIAGRTTVGTRKDMGLFPGWSLLRCRNSKKMRNSCKNSFNNQTIKMCIKDKTITGLGKEPVVLLGQENARIWLFRRIPEGVTIPLPNGLFIELKTGIKYQSALSCQRDVKMCNSNSGQTGLTSWPTQCNHPGP